MRLITTVLLFILSPYLFAEDITVKTDQELNQQSAVATTYERHWSRLPIWGKEAHDLGHKLPIPVGISLVYNDQTIDYEAEDDFSVDLTGGILGAVFSGTLEVPKDDVTIEGEDRSYQLRADAWILPFLNVFTVVGYTEGEKNVRAKLDSLSNGSPIQDALFKGKVLPLPIEYDAVNFGGGIVLAGQVEPFTWTNPIILMGMTMGTNAWTDVLDSTIQMAVSQLKVGQRYEVFGGMLTYLVGYNYQFINQEVGGNYDFRGSSVETLMKEVDFDVHIVSKETSNFGVSLNYDFGKRDEWSVFTEYSFVSWKQWTFQLGRRF